MQIKLHTETFINGAHFLKGYQGPCNRIHGHDWRLRVYIIGDSSQKDSVGILFDFGNIKKIKDTLDHYLINDIPPFDEINPTAENLSEWVYDELKKVDGRLMYKVRLYETSLGKETWAEVGDFE